MLRYMQRYLCASTSVVIWSNLARLAIRASVFKGLNVTSHDLAHLVIISGSGLNASAAKSGSLTIKYKVVSSEKGGC